MITLNKLYKKHYNKLTDDNTRKTLFINRVTFSVKALQSQIRQYINYIYETIPSQTVYSLFGPFLIF